jgi:phosphatidylglycerol---prolipoprotein diacylglyceryl transferase
MQLFLDHPGWLNPEIIPGLPFRWYGLMYVIAFVVAYLVFMRQVKLEKRNITSDEVLSLFIWCIVGLLAGARLFYCLIYQFDATIQAPWNIVWPFNSSGSSLATWECPTTAAL